LTLKMMIKMNEEDARDAISAYLDHVILRIKQDPSYEPHPILKAMMLATHNNKDGTCMGILDNGSQKDRKKRTEAYSVIMKRQNGVFTLVDIIDLNNGNKLSIIDAILLIEVSLKLEKIDGELVSRAQIENILNEVYPDINFVIVGPNNFIEARDYFKKMVEEGKVSILPDKELIENLSSIKKHTLWEDYNPKTRSLIATTWAAKDKKHGISIDSEEMPKNRVSHLAKTIFTGELKKLAIERTNKK